MELTVPEIKLAMHAILTTIVKEASTKNELELAKAWAEFTPYVEADIVAIERRQSELEKLYDRLELYLKYLEEKSGCIK